MRSDIHFSRGNVGLDCGDVGPHCGEVGLDCGDVGRYFGDAGLHCRHCGVVGQPHCRHVVLNCAQNYADILIIHLMFLTGNKICCVGARDRLVRAEGEF